MDQIKVGKFIAEMRKEKGITQKQLADQLGISDKTISKWECGNGMPEISMMIPLCNVLGMNVNELLSGEKLPAEDYTRKAEENMMHLMKENEENKRKDWSLLTAIICGILALVLTGLLVEMHNWGFEKRGLLSYWDAPAFLDMLFMEILLLSASGQWKSFLQSFSIVRGKEKNFTLEEMKKAALALDTVGRMVIGVGAFVSVCNLIMLLHHMDTPESVGPFLSYALVSVMYGVAEYLFLQPIKSRVEQKILEAEE